METRTAGLDAEAVAAFVDETWEREIVPQLTEYIAIPNKSPLFDPDWAEHGHMERAVALIEAWCRGRGIEGLSVEVVRLEGRTPLIFMEIPGESDDPGLDYNGTPLHIVFSTSCHDQMHWESYVFFYHAWKVKQPGTVTRIASGCNEKEAKQAQDFYEKTIKTMSDRFYLHLTPDFSKQ